MKQDTEERDIEEETLAKAALPKSLGRIHIDQYLLGHITRVAPMGSSPIALRVQSLVERARAWALKRWRERHPEPREKPHTHAREKARRLRQRGRNVDRVL